MIAYKNNRVQGSIGKEMATDYVFPKEKGSLPVVIYTHGFNGFKDWGNFNLIAESFANTGFFFVKFNLSHNGTSVENPTEFVELASYRNNNYSKEWFDLQCMLDHIHSEDFEFRSIINLEKVYLLGHSRGGAISILGAKDSRVSGLVTWASIAQCTSPWSRFDDEKMANWKKSGTFFYENKRTNQQLPIDYQIYEDYLKHVDVFNLERRVASLKKPMLFIHGKSDPAVPYESAEKLYQANQQNAKLLLCEGDHVFGRKHPWPHEYLPTETKFVIEKTIHFLQSC